MELQFNQHHGARSKSFKPGDAVFVRDHRNQYPRWSPGIILSRTGSVTYKVSVHNQVWLRHANQLKPRSTIESSNKILEDFDLPLLTVPDVGNDFHPETPTLTGTTHEGSSSTTAPRPGRPTRTRRAPRRLFVNTRSKTYA